MSNLPWLKVANSQIVFSSHSNKANNDIICPFLVGKQHNPWTWNTSVGNQQNHWTWGSDLVMKVAKSQKVFSFPSHLKQIGRYFCSPAQNIFKGVVTYRTDRSNYWLLSDWQFCYIFRFLGTKKDSGGWSTYKGEKVSALSCILD